jgi:hypothetical protein
MRKIHWIAASALALSLTATAAMAADGEPAKAGKYQANMVNASADCTTPSESTGGALPLPACPAVDPAVCTFGAKGQAKVAAKAKTDVALSLQVKGLEACPDGTILQAFASFKSTTNNCTVSSRCTTASLPAFPIPGATCTVAKGGCKLKTTLNTLVPGIITPGENTAIELGTVGVSTGTVNVAVAGILVP